MKKLLIVLILSVFSTSIYAQQRGGWDPEARLKQQTDALIKELSLDKETGKKLLEINKKYMEKQMKMWEEMRDGSGDREGMREKMEKMRADQEKEYKKLFTEEQFKKYKKYQEEQMKRWRQGRGGRGR